MDLHSKNRKTPRLTFYLLSGTAIAATVASLLVPHHTLLRYTLPCITALSFNLLIIHIAKLKADSIIDHAQSQAKDIILDATSKAAKIEQKRQAWLTQIDALERQVRRREDQMRKVKALATSRSRAYDPMGYARTLIKQWDISLSPLKGGKHAKHHK